MKNKVYLFLILFLIFSCQEVGKDAGQKAQKEIAQSAINDPLKTDSIFYKSVKDLINIGFYVTGKDSIFRTNDPRKLVELNTLKNAFYTPFDSTNVGLNSYLKAKNIQKYYLKGNGKSTNIAEANVIQFKFEKEEWAKEWFSHFEKYRFKKSIENKPKTVLWRRNEHVYFIQTYNTPSRKTLELLQESLNNNLNANEK